MFTMLLFTTSETFADEATQSSYPAYESKQLGASNIETLANDLSSYSDIEQLPEYSTMLTRNTDTLANIENLMTQNAEGTQEGFELHGPYWLPDGFWDGPSQQDIGYIALTFIFGQPVVKAFETVTGIVTGERILPSDPSYRATLPTSFAQMMNTLGLLLIGGIVVAYLLGFFIKRSYEIGYLKNDEKEESVYSLGRSSIALIGSLPMTAFYGLSSLQMVTLSCALIGLGMSSAVIQYGTGMLLTPTIMATQYPAVNDYLDQLLFAKVCTIALEDEMMGKIENSSSSDKYGVNGETNPFLYLEYTDEVSYKIRTYGTTNDVITKEPDKSRVYKYYFGPDAECGYGELGKVTQAGLETKTYDTAADAIVEFTKTSIAQHQYNTVLSYWNELKPIAEAIIDEEFQEQMSGDEKKSIVLARQYAQMKRNLSQSVITDISNTLDEIHSSKIILNHETGSNTSIANMKKEIASVGMFGLGTMYVALAEFQDNFTDQINSSYQEISDINFQSNRISYYGTALTLIENVYRLFAGDNNDEKKRIIGSYYTFVNSPESSTANNILTSNIKQTQESSVFDWLIALFEKMFAGMYSLIANGTTNTDTLDFHATDPILQIRNMGATVQNTVFAIWTASAIKNIISDSSKSNTQDSDFSSGSDSKFGEATTFIMLWLISLLAWGFFAANIIPQIPYVMWTIACFSHLSFIVMAVMGTGWWGGSMTLKGQNQESLMGKSHDGFNILISLIIRPPLMTIGFFTALILNKTLGYIVNSTLEPAMISANSGIFNPFHFFGMLLVSTFILTVGIYKNCALIWELTDLFMRFIGLDRDHLKEDGSKEAQQQFVSKGQGASGQITGVMNKSMHLNQTGQVPFAS